MSLLCAEHITKSFYGNVAVNDVSCAVEAGQIVGLIGANGAGKTTFFNCLTGYYRPTSGRVLFEGERIDRLDAHKICRRGIARTFQITRPFGELTVRENAVVGAYNRAKSRAEADAVAEEKLAFVGLAHRMDAHAGLLNTGEQRQLELARALATGPKLLLLDEVMAGLTPSESVQMVGLIRAIRDSGVTILMIEHVMTALMSLSDRVLAMDRGSLICQGTPAQVAADKGVIEAYLGDPGGDANA